LRFRKNSRIKFFIHSIQTNSRSVFHQHQKCQQDSQTSSDRGKILDLTARLGYTWHWYGSTFYQA